MKNALIYQLADFAAGCRYEDLPERVVEESKRVLLDSIGCGLAGVEHEKGQIGTRFGRMMGGDEATIIGSGEKASVCGAAFANGELVSALDFDAILPPGHVSPYAIPVALAAGESVGASGRSLIAAIAVSHEMSCRMGNAMSQNRDTVNGKSADAPVLGYASTVLGTAAAAAMLRGLGTTKIADTLGIAAATSPVNSHKAWCLHSPPSTIKYMLAGTLTQSALTASYMAEFGHRGDHQALDDVEFGYARYIGTIKWAPENITNGLGSLWTFPDLQSYKIYPHVRINAAPLDLMIEIVGAHDIKVEEIESVKAFGEGWAELPSFMNRNIQHVQDAQFSFVHALAVAAHGYEPGKQWQRPDVVFNPSVLNLMERISWEVHPNFFNAYAANPLSRPSRLEVHARGQVFVGEKGYPKGSPSSDPSTYATNDELIEKFKKNASGVLKDSSSDKIIDAVFNLEDLTDIRQLMYYSGGGD